MNITETGETDVSGFCDLESGECTVAEAVPDQDPDLEGPGDQEQARPHRLSRQASHQMRGQRPQSRASKTRPSTATDRGSAV